MSLVTYTWKVTGLKTQNESNLEGVVIQTFWKKIGTDEVGITGEFVGITSFNAASVDSGSFVPFDELTESVVLGWIQNSMNISYEEHINQRIWDEISKKKNPVIDVNDGDFPWSPVTPPNTGSGSV